MEDWRDLRHRLIDLADLGWELSWPELDPAYARTNYRRVVAAFEQITALAGRLLADLGPEQEVSR